MFKRIPVKGKFYVGMRFDGKKLYVTSKCVYLVDDGVLYARFNLPYTNKWFVKKLNECWQVTQYKTLANIKNEWK